MKIVNKIRNFEFTATGGVAIYFLICVAFVTIAGAIQLGGHIANWLK